MTKLRPSFILWPTLIALSCAVGIFSFAYVRMHINDESRLRFADESEAVRKEILEESGILGYARSLENLQGFFAASVSVERNEFDTFIEHARYAQTFPATRAFTYIRRVTAAERGAFVRMVRGDTSLEPRGYPNFSITPTSTSAESYVVTYVKPFASNEQMLGEDLLADPIKHAAVEEARDTGALTATSLFTYEGKKYFSIYLPVYKNGAPRGTVEDRRANIVGLLAATIDPEAMLAPSSNTPGAVPKIHITLINDATGTTGTTKSVIFEYNGEAGRNKEEPIPSRMGLSFTYQIGNTNWTLMLSRNITENLTPLEISLPYVGGVSAFIIILLLCGIFYSIFILVTKTSRAAEELAGKLLEAEQRLAETSTDVVLDLDAGGKIISINDSAMRLLGYTLEDVAGIHIGRTGMLGGSSVTDFMRELERALRGESLPPFELQLVKRGGGVLIAEANLTLLREKDVATGARLSLHDITTRKQAERALNESVTQFKRFAEAANDAILVLGNSAVLFANGRNEALLKYSPSELAPAGSFLRAAVAQESREAITNALERLERGGWAADTECTLLTKDRKRIFSVVSLSRVAYENKPATIVIIKDISARKIAEQRAAMENAIARTIRESTPETDAAKQLLGDIATVFHWQFGDIWMENQKTNEMECYNTWVQPGYNLLPFESKTRLLAFKKGAGLPGRVWETGKPKWIPSILNESNFYRKKEAEESGLLTAFAFPLIVGKTTIGVAEFFTDSKMDELSQELFDTFLSLGSSLGQFLKQRMANEEIARNLVDLKKFLLAVEWTEDSVIITDIEGIVQYANRAAEKTNGYSRAEIVGQKAGRLWGNLMPREFYKNMWDIIKYQQKTFTGEIRNRRKNGEEYLASVNISPVFDEMGIPRFFVATERDITQEKAVDRAKTEFVSLASHQLRTPLTAINWYSEMLLGGDVGSISDKQRSYIEEIYNGGRRLVILVNSLLNVSRVELGTFVVNPEPTNVADVCDVTLKELALLTNSKRLTLTRDFAADIPVMNMDRSLIQIIFQNIVTNAVEYTPEGGRVTVTLRKEGESLLFKVSDTGIGIPAANQGKIFEKMYRADNARDVKTYGTGLGLYLVKSIVDQSKGRIWFESKENIGTTFFVTLPLSGMAKKEGTKMLSPIRDVV